MKAAFAIKLLLRFLALWPLPWIHGIAVVPAWLVYRFDNRIKSLAQTNIRLCFPELPESRQEQLLRTVLLENAKAFLELGALWLWPVNRLLALVRQVSGVEHMESARRQGKGVILLTPHLGGWELCGLYSATQDSMASLYRPPRMHRLENILRRGRERSGAHLVSTDQKGVRYLFKHLKQRGITGILPDQEPKGGNGEFAPFFGIPAYTMVLAWRLAHKTGSPVVFIYAERLPRGKGFHIHYLPAPEGIYSDDTGTALTAMNQGLENCIRACPQQYLWTYKRFNTRPPGEERFYA